MKTQTDLKTELDWQRELERRRIVVENVILKKLIKLAETGDWPARTSVAVNCPVRGCEREFTAD